MCDTPGRGTPPRISDHPLMTVNETAARLRYSRETVRRMVHNGVLAAIIGGSGTHQVIRVPRSLVDRMLADAEAGECVVIADRSEAWREQAGGGDR